MKNIIKKIASLPNYINNTIQFFMRKPTGKWPRVNGKIYMVSDRNAIKFGDDVTINSNLESNPIGGSTRTILFAKHGAKITIGNNVGISNSAIIAAENISIGNYVLIGGDCSIYDTDFHWLNFDRRISESGGVSKPVCIEDGAFIGAHSIVLKGVKIGAHSIIGAGSVVTKSIPPYEVWAGNPAEFIKRLGEDD